MEYILRCILVSLQVDDHVLQQAVAGVFLRDAGRFIQIALVCPRAEELCVVLVNRR